MRDAPLPAQQAQKRLRDCGGGDSLLAERQ